MILDSKFRWLLGCISACFLFASLPAFAATKPLQGTEIQVGLSIAPPFVIIVDDFDQPKGIEVDIIREMQRRLGFTLKNDGFRTMNMPELIELTKQGVISIAAGSMTASEARKKILEMPTPYTHNAQVIVSRVDSPINSFDDMSNKILSVRQGSNAAQFTKKNPKMRVVYTSSTFMNVYYVATGRADAVILDEPVGRGYASIWPGKLAISQPLPGTSGPVSIAFPKDAEINKYLIGAYNEMLEDGTIARILEKYNNPQQI